MALVTANGVGVVSGTIMRPLVGVWTADLVIDQIDGTGFDPGAKVTIQAGSDYSISGVVDQDRAGSFLQAVHVRVLGGAGGMSKPASARSYVQPGAFVRDVVNGLVADAGEALSSTSNTGFLATNLTAWSVLGGSTVARNLRALIDIVSPSTNWRILSDGTLWLGSESWPQTSTTFDLMVIDRADGSYHLGVESPFIAPGVNIPGVGNVSRVLDTIESHQLRSRVWIDFAAGDRGANGAVQALAKQALPGVDYYASYICQVVSQSADLTTVDVNPVGARNRKLLGGMQRVPVRFGTGVKIQVAAGATVLLSWDGGNPASPYVCCGLSGDSAIKIQLAGSDAVVTATDIANLKATISAAAVVAQDGGAAFKANILAGWPASVGSQIVGAGR